VLVHQAAFPPSYPWIHRKPCRELATPSMAACFLVSLGTWWLHSQMTGIERRNRSCIPD
jgi:hypothetical protein